MKNLQKLFKMSPAIRKIIGESNPTNRNKKLMELFVKVDGTFCKRVR